MNVVELKFLITCRVLLNVFEPIRVEDFVVATSQEVIT